MTDSLPSPEQCEWAEDEYGTWETSCGNAFEINDGSPADNDMAYCCYCGKKIAQCRYVEETDGE